MRVTNPRRSVRLGMFPVRSEKSNLPPLSGLQDERELRQSKTHEHVSPQLAAESLATLSPNLERIDTHRRASLRTTGSLHPAGSHASAPKRGRLPAVRITNR